MKYNLVIFLLCGTSFLLYSTGDKAYKIRNKTDLRACICLLYPEITQKSEIDVLASRKNKEWGHDFKKALEQDSLEKVQRFINVGFFVLQDTYVAHAYQNKSIQVMKYFLEKRLHDYEKQSLVEKGKTNFFSFLNFCELNTLVKSELDSFMPEFKEYFWLMRFWNNFNAPNLNEQIKKYNNAVSQVFIIGPSMVKGHPYARESLHLLRKKFKESTFEQQNYLLTAAQIFKHDDVIRQLQNFPIGLFKVHGLANTQFQFDSPL